MNTVERIITICKDQVASSDDGRIRILEYAKMIEKEYPNNSVDLHLPAIKGMYTK